MTAPMIDTASIEHLDHRPACDREGCDREAVWWARGHDCDHASALVDALWCDPCRNEYHDIAVSSLPCTCKCGIRWTTWRQMVPREERIR